jgi:hypothetical protein
MTLAASKLRKVVNMLGDPLQAHAAAHLLAVEAKERGVLISDLVAEGLAPSTTAPAPPTFTDVDSNNPFAGIGKRIDRDHYGLCAFITHETEKAWLVQGPDSDEEVWLPKSQCEHHGEDPGGRAILIVPMWLARKKGFLC